MGKRIYCALIGTVEQFERVPKDNNILEIKDAHTYWDDTSGTIMVVASQEWRDYLTGKSDMRPED
jgi:hypothetical protein